MTETSDEPRLTQTPRGWLAVTPADDDHPRIGVEGVTKDEALQRYREARACWRLLLAAPEPVHA